MRRGYNTTKSIVPSDFQQIEYITNNDTAWIDTGVVQNRNTCVEITYRKCLSVGSYGYGLQSSGARDYGFLSDVNKDFSWIHIFGETYTRPHTFNETDKHTAILSSPDNSFYHDGVKMSMTGSLTRTSTTPHEITLFCVRHFSYYTFKDYESHAKGDIYSVKIYDGPTNSYQNMVRDFVPVIQKSNNEIGLYDLVEGKFYGNSNSSGSFSAGPIIR